MRFFIGDIAVDFVKVSSDSATIFFPGWTGTRYGPQRVFVSAEKYVNEKGGSTVRFDFRGRGDSFGNAMNITLDDMIEDAEEVIKWLVENEGIQRFHLVGLCSGGNVVLGVCSLPSVSKYITKITCWSLLPYMEDKKHAKRQGTNRLSRFKALAVKAFSREGIAKLVKREANIKGALKSVAKDKEGDESEKVRKTSSRRILNDVARNYQGPVHLIFGTKDPEADGSEYFYSDWFYRHNNKLEITRIEGAPHNFYTVHWTAELISKTFPSV